MPNTAVRAAAEGMLAIHRPHPRAVRLALAAINIESCNGSVGFRDLFAAGFSAAELVEHMLAAEHIAEVRP